MDSFQRDSKLYTTIESAHITNVLSLQNCPESRIPTTVQPQEISHLAKVINTPESLSLATGRRAFKPRQSKSTSLERAVRIAHQERLDIRPIHLRIDQYHCNKSSLPFLENATYSRQNFLRLLLAKNTLKDRREAIRLANLRVTVNPERAVQSLNDGRKLGGRRLREGAESALDSQGPRWEAVGHLVGHGDGEVLGPAFSLFADPNILVYRVWLACTRQCSDDELVYTHS